MKRRSQDASSFTRLALLPNPKRRLSPRYISHNTHTKKSCFPHTHTHAHRHSSTFKTILVSHRAAARHSSALPSSLFLSCTARMRSPRERARARRRSLSLSLFLLLVTCIHAWNTYEIALRFSCLHLQSLASRFRFPNFEYIHERDARTHQHRTRQCRPHRAMPNPEHRSCSSPPHNSIHMVFLLSEALRSTLH